MKNTIEVINELKKEKLIKDYAVGGAIGALKWVELFFTSNLDIFIIPVKETEKLINLSPIYEYLKKKGYYWKGQWIIIEEVPVYFIPADALGKEAVENAEETEYEGIKTKVITPEYLIALFLKAGRDKDVRKTEMLLEQAKVDTGKLDKILEEYGLTSKFVKFKKRRHGR
ncbi:hypothetical protein KAU86_00425 [bacterium]|nr:hypothetical protein [bacterium]